MNWGQKEHDAEKASESLLAVDTCVGAAAWYLHVEWLCYVLVVLVSVTLIVHSWARYAHFMEKRAWKKVRGR